MLPRTNKLFMNFTTVEMSNFVFTACKHFCKSILLLFRVYLLLLYDLVLLLFYLLRYFSAFLRRFSLLSFVLLGEDSVFADFLSLHTSAALFSIVVAIVRDDRAFT